MNLHLKDVDKIEIFTPYGYNYDNGDGRVEIDGKLFNYNNLYYKIYEDDLDYVGVKCKILDTITKNRIK